MKTATVKELKTNISQYLKEMEQEDILILLDGKPQAVLHHLVGDELEDYIIANSPAIREDIEKAYQEYLNTGGVELNAFIKKTRTLS